MVIWAYMHIAMVVPRDDIHVQYLGM